MTYKPLSPKLTIKQKYRGGYLRDLGVFAIEDIEENTLLGTSHYLLDNGGLLRTTLGGYYNHSDHPNAR